MLLCVCHLSTRKLLSEIVISPYSRITYYYRYADSLSCDPALWKDFEACIAPTATRYCQTLRHLEGFSLAFSIIALFLLQ
jgi:hypothetical protein